MDVLRGFTAGVGLWDETGGDDDDDVDSVIVASRSSPDAAVAGEPLASGET